MGPPTFTGVLKKKQTSNSKAHWISSSFPPSFLCVMLSVCARGWMKHYFVASPTVCWYYDNLNSSNVLHWIGHQIPDPTSLSPSFQTPPNYFLSFFLIFLLFISLVVVLHRRKLFSLNVYYCWVSREYTYIIFVSYRCAYRGGREKEGGRKQ